MTHHHRSVRGSSAVAVAVVVAAAVLGGCSGGGSSPSPTTAPTPGSGAPATAAPAPPVDTLKGALLVPDDVPGSRPAASQAKDFDYSACFPGNPLGAVSYPGEVESTDLEVLQGGVRRTFSSAVRPATAEQATEFLATLSSAAGSACVVDALKKGIAGGGPTPAVDASSLTGTASTADVADGASVLSIGGNLTTATATVPAAFNLVFFRKGSLLGVVTVGGVGGPGVPDQAVELAQKVASRLP